jgi:hypothetical protein
LLRREENGIVTYSFESITAERVGHGVFARQGGISQGAFASLNTGSSVGDDQDAVAENHSRIYAHLGLDAGQVITAHQVHGNRIAVVASEDAGRVLPSADGLATDTPDLALMLRFADCQPILLYDPEHHALVLAHAGWRGAALGIAYRAVETMRAAFGTEPEQLVAGLGPAIGPCCYTVGHEVAAAMGYALPDWTKVMTPEGDSWKLDLSGANAQQLTAAGVKHIEQANLCTACNQDEFFSHRGSNGRTGRFAVMAFLRPGTGSRPAEQAVPVADSEPWGSGLEPDTLQPQGLPSFGEMMGDR